MMDNTFQHSVSMSEKFPLRYSGHRLGPLHPYHLLHQLHKIFGFSFLNLTEFVWFYHLVNKEAVVVPVLAFVPLSRLD